MGEISTDYFTAKDVISEDFEITPEDVISEDFEITPEDVISEDFEITPVSQSSQRFLFFPFSLRKGKGKSTNPAGLVLYFMRWQLILLNG
ncbi:MAG: hypothetical protein EHM45_20430 [Desulfobacteraceae bacterium]|nr:MAG: hypothetical protein EHM45_20430 [Desulfobacteraceae bacterium]